LALTRGAHQAEDHVGILTQRVPCLLPVDDVVLTAPLGPRLERRQVRSRAGFRVALTPPILAGEDTRQVILLLPGAAERDDDASHHVHAERDPGRSTGLGAGFVEQVLLHCVPTRAAIFRRPAGRNPAPLEQDLLPADVVLLAEPVMLQHLARDVGWQVGANECAYLRAESLLFWRVVEIHGSILPI